MGALQYWLKHYLPVLIVMVFKLLFDEGQYIGMVCTLLSTLKYKE